MVRQSLVRGLTLRTFAAVVVISLGISVLSSPVVSGDSAVYPEVLPGVDLRVRATLLGFGHDLVVKTPAAATNPALRKISFDLAMTGATVTVDEHGNSKAVDAGGNVLVHASPPRMRETPAARARGQEPPEDKSAPVGLEVTGSEFVFVAGQGDVD